jgi:hypothetical protein
MKASMKPVGDQVDGYQFYACPRCRKTADIQVETIPAPASVLAQPRSAPYSEVGL